ncbi:MAG: amidohydrolase [Chromatiales bacterium]|nr:amidohydrolase [Chromatiales bacterium]
MTKKQTRRQFFSTLAATAASMLAGGGVFSSVFAASNKSADIVYRNGRIYTVNPMQPWAEAIAVSGGRIVAIGDNNLVEGSVGKQTKVVNLGGAFVLPGFHDCHLHPHFIYRDKVAGRLSLSPSDTQEQVLNKIAEYARKHPEGWIAGSVWNGANFEGGRLTAAMIEKVAPGRAVWLKDTTGHNAAASKAALKLAGITRDTPSPFGGFIEKGDDGEPTGFLSDNASAMVGGVLPGPPLEVYRKCIPMALNVVRANGVTAIGDMAGRYPIHETYKALENSGELNLKVMLTVGMFTEGRHGDGTWEAHAQPFVETVDKYNSHLIDAKNVKFWADGTPPGLTSLMLESYQGDLRGNAPPFYGAVTWSKDVQETMRAYDLRGLRIHVHSVGDGTTRQVLDIFEEIRANNPHNPVKHHISHLSYVSDEDLARMGRLGITAEMSPDVWFPGVTSHACEVTLGKKLNETGWPVKRIMDSGLELGFGSDWGSSGRDYSVMASLEALLTRKNPWGKAFGSYKADEAYAPDQAIDLPAALRMLTINGARLMQHERERGSLEVGKYADMVVLSDNLFDLVEAGDQDKINQVEVLKTVFEGEVSFTAS